MLKWFISNTFVLIGVNISMIANDNQNIIHIQQGAL